MISPRELVLTAPLKNRRLNGASGSDGLSTIAWNAAVCSGAPARTRTASTTIAITQRPTMNENHDRPRNLPRV